MADLFGRKKKGKDKQPKEEGHSPGIDLEDHSVVLIALEKAQSDEIDLRSNAREAHSFIDKRGGQWEEFWWNASDDKPRYTFDLTTNVVNQISGSIKKADFSGHIKPNGGTATQDLAKIFEGMVRNIQSVSQATNTYNSSAKSMVTSGLDGWEIVAKFIDDDSFDQDLAIENVEDWADRVWFSSASQKQDKSDSMFAWKFTGFTPEEYKRKWPDGSGQGLGSDKIANTYFNKPDLIMVGQFYYIKEVERELVLMSNGHVYEADEKFKRVQDELKALEVVEVRRRKRLKRVCHTRKMDGHDWLDDAQETVFNFVPLIPTFANYKITEGKMIYYGAVEKRIDPQRVFNYTMSREIEEGALAPRAKTWMTEKQSEGHEDTLATMNTNTDPVQFYTPDPDTAQVPFQVPGAPINPGLRVMSQATGELISQTAGQFEAFQGDNPNAQSGVAIDKLQTKGDVTTVDYFESQEIAICHTMRILIDAIPRVYVGERQVRILKEDDSEEMVTLNQGVLDEETQEMVTLNDLSIGTYDVTCKAGPSFQNRQQETVTGMVEVANVDPSILEIGGDILFNNMTAPGMSLIAERKRQQLFQAGVIPEEQWTDEEKEQVELQQQLAQLQPPEPDPAQMIGQAELIKAQNEQAETQIGVAEKQAKIQLASRKEDREDFKAGAEQKNNTFTQILQTQQFQAQALNDAVKQLNEQAATWKLLREAMGIDTIAGPGGLQAFVEQAQIIRDSQTQ